LISPPPISTLFPYTTLFRSHKQVAMMDDIHEEIIRAEFPALVVAERDRRLAMGFDYDFQDERGVHRISTTPADMAGWDEVTKLRSEEHTSELQSRENLVCRL